MASTATTVKNAAKDSEPTTTAFIMMAASAGPRLWKVEGAEEEEHHRDRGDDAAELWPEVR